MGINISVWRIKGVLSHIDKYPTQEYKYFYKVRHPTWDSLRYSGDKEFMNEVEFNIRWEGDEEPEHSFEQWYCRPKDFDTAIKWVNEKIEMEGNKKRLLDILEEMKDDPDLYFTVSY